MMMMVSFWRRQVSPYLLARTPTRLPLHCLCVLCCLSGPSTSFEYQPTETTQLLGASSISCPPYSVPIFYILWSCERKGSMVCFGRKPSSQRRLNHFSADMWPGRKLDWVVQQQGQVTRLKARLKLLLTEYALNTMSNNHQPLTQRPDTLWKIAIPGLLHSYIGKALCWSTL